MKDGFFDGATPYLFIFLVGILTLSIRYRKKHPVVLLGVMWFFITLSVESSIFPIKDALFEHRLYLPMFGFSLILSYGVFLGLSAYRYWAYSVSAVIVIILTVAAFYRNDVWRSSVSLWSDAVKKNPSNYRAMTNLAYAYEQAGNMESAMSYYDGAIRLKPDYHYALSNKGALLGRMGKPDEAIKLFYKALEIKPNYPLALNNLGVSLGVQNKTREAIGYFQKAVRFQPGYMDAHNNLVMAYQHEGDYDNALKECFNIIQLYPDDAAAHNRAGVLLHTVKRYAEAVEQYNKAINLDPSLAEVYLNKGNALMVSRTKRYGC